MTELDYGTFERAFGRVCGAFRIKLKPVEQTELSRTYFRVLEAFPVDDVLDAGKACLTRHRTFPRPADWFALLTQNGTTAALCPVDRRVMTQGEVDALARATALRYTDSPCTCLECQMAGVSDQPLRFVPTRVGDEDALAFHQGRNRVEVVGHWAHGDELAGWYQAQARWQQRAAVTGKRPLRARTGQSREPGEEG